MIGTVQFNGEVDNIESNINKVDSFDESISEEEAKQKYPSLMCLKNQNKVINSTFVNALKGSKSGAAFLISDVSPVTHDMGVKVRSKNLIPYPFAYETFESNGITFTDNKDGTITLNGQNNRSAISNYNLFQSADKLSFLKPNTDYYLSCNLDNIISSLRTVTSSGTYKYYSYGNINFSSDETPDRLFIQIKITDTTTYDNTIVKLQIELGTTSADYTPYVPDLTAVKVIRCGKNLLPYPFVYETVTSNGITFTDNKDGTITLNGQNNGSDHSTYNLFNVKDKLYLLKPNTDYCYYGNINDVNYTLGTVTLSGNNKYYTNSIINFPDSETPVRLMVQIKKGDTRIFNNTIIKPQIELGTNDTDYEPCIAPTEYTPTTDGTVEGVSSLYPNTTLTTDTEGVLIDCEYNRDINKAFAEMQAAIISLGGNV